MGLSFFELDMLEYGEVMDMMTEADNDRYKYRYIADQDDFDKF